jgi:hypothetical protein
MSQSMMMAPNAYGGSQNIQRTGNNYHFSPVVFFFFFFVRFWNSNSAAAPHRFGLSPPQPSIGGGDDADPAHLLRCQRCRIRGGREKTSAQQVELQDST